MRCGSSCAGTRADVANLKVRVHAGDPPAGLGPLAAGPEGCFFQTPGWLGAVVRAEPRLQPLTVCAEEAGALRAACPLLVARAFGVWRLYGGAWGTYGGVVAADAEAAVAVRGGLQALARRARVALVRMHDFAGTVGEVPGFAAGAETCQVLDLPPDPEAVFRDAFTSQNRNKIRKAEKLGVTVQCGNDAESLREYMALYRESAGRWGVERPLPEALFAALAGLDGVQVWRAALAGRTIAALLNFAYGGQVMNWGNVSRQDAWGASPNNLLHWRAIEAACRTAGGPRLYNFGASTGLPGVETFKAAFGARPVSYARREAQAGWLAWIQRARGRGGR